jgi:hypothetical protein
MNDKYRKTKISINLLQIHRIWKQWEVLKELLEQNKINTFLILKVLPIAVHGDAIAGQGILYEIANGTIGGYKTGGTIHIVINQVDLQQIILMDVPRLIARMSLRYTFARPVCQR